jgi:hypothetical protein
MVNYLNLLRVIIYLHYFIWLLDVLGVVCKVGLVCVVALILQEHRLS